MPMTKSTRSLRILFRDVLISGQRVECLSCVHCEECLSEVIHVEGSDEDIKRLCIRSDSVR